MKFGDFIGFPKITGNYINVQNGSLLLILRFVD